MRGLERTSLVPAKVKRLEPHVADDNLLLACVSCRQVWKETREGVCASRKRTGELRCAAPRSAACPQPGSHLADAERGQAASARPSSEASARPTSRDRRTSRLTRVRRRLVDAELVVRQHVHQRRLARIVQSQEEDLGILLEQAWERCGRVGA